MGGVEVKLDCNVTSETDEEETALGCDDEAENRGIGDTGSIWLWLDMEMLFIGLTFEMDMLPRP